MGREVRRVPLDWEHPRDKRGEYQPMHDEDYETASAEWKAGYELWKRGEHPDQDDYEYWEYDYPPDSKYYRERRWTPEEAIGYQVYETVSEGTPISPVFATKDEMVDWLVEQGYSRHAAESFAEEGWVPSMVMDVSGGRMKMASDINIFDMVAGGEDQE